MTARPTGTITFLFTDIEGSTRLWERYPVGMQGAFARHETILREAIAAHGGYAYKMIGDAFQAAFQRAPDALAASVDAQCVLATEPWGELGELRVRMALHTGIAEERGDDYVGPVLNRLARVLAAGHGGQILLTATTRELVRDALPPGTLLRDLGERRLKDLIRSERIFQVVAPELPADFPPLKALDARPNNLPVQQAPLLGRERELQEVAALLRGESRLVTLTGPGGTGKTSLSLQLAADLSDDFPDGVWFVPLAAIRDAELVPTQIAQALDLSETGSTLPSAKVKEFLRDRRALLVLDNFEQVTTAAPLVADYVASCPNLKILVTSRTPLRLAGEQEYPVPPLALPDPRRIGPGKTLPVPVLSQYAAVRLFIDRAKAVKPDFRIDEENAPAVAEICVRLDGLPLAIELAAARSKLLPPQALLARLSNRLALLKSSSPTLTARQQTLRGAIDWSYDLLTPGEQMLFARLGVFADGCDLEAVEGVCNADGDLPVDVLDAVESLVDKSLLRSVEDQDGEPRLVMLETIREYALERLQRDEAVQAIQRRHATYYVALAGRAEPHLDGPEQQAWKRVLRRDHENMRLAMQWSLQHTEPELAARLGGSLWRFWWIQGNLTEGRAWLSQVLSADSLPTPVHAKALKAAGALASFQGDYRQAHELMAESLTLYRSLGDPEAISTTLSALGMIVSDEGDYEAAEELFAEALSLAEQRDDRHSMAFALGSMGNMAYFQGNLSRARELYEQSLALHQEQGDTYSVAVSLHNLGEVARDMGDAEQALLLYQEGLAAFRELDAVYGVAQALRSLGALAYHQGQYERAKEWYVEALPLLYEIGHESLLLLPLASLGAIALEREQMECAARLLGVVETLQNAVSFSDPDHRADHEEPVARLRTEIGEAYPQERREGQRMTLERAVAFAASS